MKNLLAVIFFAAASITTGSANASDTRGCRIAGPGASFCAESDFARVDIGSTEGLSYWLDSRGYLSKVVVQNGPADGADQARIEAEILAMVTRQALDIGRAFEFDDLTSATAGEAPFGTLSYSLSGARQDQPILHSYVAVEGIIVQVISQIAVNGAARDADGLMLAHHRALEAIHLDDTDPQT